MIHDKWTVLLHRYPLLVDRVFVKFMPAYSGIKVGTILHTFVISHLTVRTTAWGLWLFYQIKALLS